MLVGRQAERSIDSRAPEPRNAGLAVITELCGRLGVIGPPDTVVGPIKQCERGFGARDCWPGSRRRS